MCRILSSIHPSASTAQRSGQQNSVTNWRSFLKSISLKTSLHKSSIGTRISRKRLGYRETMEHLKELVRQMLRRYKRDSWWSRNTMWCLRGRRSMPRPLLLTHSRSGLSSPRISSPLQRSWSKLLKLSRCDRLLTKYQLNQSKRSLQGMRHSFCTTVMRSRGNMGSTWCGRLSLKTTISSNSWMGWVVLSLTIKWLACHSNLSMLTTHLSRKSSPSTDN